MDEFENTGVGPGGPDAPEPRPPRRRRPPEVVVWLPNGFRPIVSDGISLKPMQPSPPPSWELEGETGTPWLPYQPGSRRSRLLHPMTLPPLPAAPGLSDTPGAYDPAAAKPGRRMRPTEPIALPPARRLSSTQATGWILPGKRLEGAPSAPTVKGGPALGAVDRWVEMHLAGMMPATIETVTPDVEAQARQVIREYEMRVSAMELITTKPDKGGAIWRMETDKGPRSLKLLHRTRERSLFSVGAQEYLVKRGARVPALVAARDGSKYVEVDGRLWIVTDWIQGLTPATKVDMSGAQELCYGLGLFHKLSKGYEPPIGAKRASRLYRWPNTYQKMLTKIGWFRELALAFREAPAAHTLLGLLNGFEQQARDAIARLTASPYGSLVARGETEWGIVHQDYGWSNGQMGPGGLWIIDLDGVAYDLPIRDLRKLIASTMDDMGAWDVVWIKGMIDAYRNANPIDPELYQMLLIDFSLPNEFYKNVKEIVQNPVQFMTTELDALLRRIAEGETTKWPALRELGLPGLTAGRGR